MMTTIKIIFARAVCEVWKERVRSGECSFKEFNNILENKIKGEKLI